MLRPLLARVAALSILALPASAQSFNIDLEGTAGTPNPLSTFGAAAGSPGIWNDILAAQGLYGNLVTTASLPATNARISISTGNSGRCSFTNGCTTGAQPGGSNNAALMNDFLRFNGGLTIQMRGMEPGTYSVYVYGWAADNPMARTRVFGEDLGGAWPANNQQLLNTTYATKSGIVVGAAGRITIDLSVQTSVGTVNGLQIVKTSTTIGSNYCPTMPNSTGIGAEMIAVGSPVAIENFFLVGCANMPRNSFCVFITSQTPQMVPASGFGYLCVGGAVARGVGGQIFNSGSDGYVLTFADLTAHPTPTGPTTVLPGDTWYIQCWMRDFLFGAPTSITSNGVAVTFT